jgi:Lrp/AsnC family transcriptional regulator
MMNEIDHIDAVDRRIIRELQRDASLSHAAVAEKVGASSASVWRRVRKPREIRRARRAVRLADPKALGREVNVLCQVG